MNSQHHTKETPESRTSELQSLRVRIRNHDNSGMTAKEAALLEEAILLMEEKQAEEARKIPSQGHKPVFLSLVTVLGGIVSFVMPAMILWQTSITPALIASAIGLVVGVAAVKLDPGYKGHWLHDVD